MQPTQPQTALSLSSALLCCAVHARRTCPIAVILWFAQPWQAYITLLACPGLCPFNSALPGGEVLHAF